MCEEWWKTARSASNNNENRAENETDYDAYYNSEEFYVTPIIRTVKATICDDDEHFLNEAWLECSRNAHFLISFQSGTVSVLNGMNYTDAFAGTLRVNVEFSVNEMYEKNNLLLPTLRCVINCVEEYGEFLLETK